MTGLYERKGGWPVETADRLNCVALRGAGFDVGSELECGERVPWYRLRREGNRGRYFIRYRFRAGEADNGWRMYLAEFAPADGCDDRTLLQASTKIVTPGSGDVPEVVKYHDWTSYHLCNVLPDCASTAKLPVSSSRGIGGPDVWTNIRVWPAETGYLFDTLFKTYPKAVRIPRPNIKDDTLDQLATIPLPTPRVGGVSVDDGRAPSFHSLSQDSGEESDDEPENWGFPVEAYLAEHPDLAAELG